MKLFGTDGIRGRANVHPITAEVALRLGRALPDVLAADAGRPRVVIGRDPRLSGPMLEAAVTAGLLSAGADVLLAGILPTPALAHLTRSLSADAGVMITASHNPFEDNGLKVFRGDGYKLSDEAEAALEAALLAPEPPAAADAGGLGRVEVIADATGGYLERLRSSVPDLRLDGLTLVVDAGNGAASALAAGLFESLGARVIATGDAPDGRNINDGCGALHPERAAALVREHGADLGISFDGDADRVIFTATDGEPVSGDRILALAALALHEQGALKGATVAVTVMTNLGLHETLRPAGIAVVTTAVGDRHVLEALRAGGFSFGGENSGHLIFSDHATTGDGMLAALQILGMMRRKNASLAELAAGMDEFPQKLVNLRVAAKPPLDRLPALQAAIAAADAAFGDAGRHLIRYSGTENKIRILVEHRDAAEVEAWIQRFTEAVEQDIGAPA